MTKNKKSQITASELSRELASDPDFVARKEAQERERVERSERLRAEEAPILADLKEVGCEVKSIWDLVNTASKYPSAIPILIKHLQLPYLDRTREGLARSLATEEAQGAWTILVNEYRKAPTGMGIKVPGDTQQYKLGAKDGLACALAATVTDATFGEFIDLLMDQANGPSRILLLPVLRKSKNPMAKQAVEELADDPDLKKEIASWRKR